MTGIIICDKCKEPFLAHGKRDSLPIPLKKIRLFHGIRSIRSEDQTHSTVSKFDDICNECREKKN
jgi:formylmethanofuran dehydrogenase subunit E